jgi:Zn-dependent peptidase ImmA (M78 family)
MIEANRPRLARIAEKARRLVSRCGTRDPFRIAHLLGIYVLYPEGLVHLKGFYRVIEGKRFIFLNRANSESINRIVCAHELGHDALHREYAEKQAFQELELFGHASRHEYEANLFLAELLIEDEEMLAYVKEGKTNEEVARLTDTHPSLAALKCELLIAKGHPLRAQSYDAGFLKN